MAQTTQTSTGHAPAEHGGGFPPFDSHTFGGQLLWLAIAFGALYVLMSKVALPRVAAILEEDAGELATVELSGFREHRLSPCRRSWRR